MTHYRVPEDGMYVLNVSGGRSSAYMAYHVLNAYDGQLPKNLVPIFTNTGKEYEETYEFLHQLETRWGLPLVWLEYNRRDEAKGGFQDRKNDWKQVSFETANRTGQPFDELIRVVRRLPQPYQRQCTFKLKILPVRHYMKDVLNTQDKDFKSILGIRYDEPRRWGKALIEECKVLYPLVMEQVTNKDVFDFWETQDFDLNLESYKSNCDMCFLKTKAQLVQIIKEDPEKVQWWLDKENNHHKLVPKDKEQRVYRFLMHMSYQDLVQIAENNETINEPEQQVLSCFCGD